jgi:hypothetical protein
MRAGLAAWAFTFGFGWLWWRYFKTGVVYSHGGKFRRVDSPFNYWFAMVSFGAAIVGGAVCATALMFDYGL